MEKNNEQYTRHFKPKYEGFFDKYGDAILMGILWIGSAVVAVDTNRRCSRYNMPDYISQQRVARESRLTSDF